MSNDHIPEGLYSFSGPVRFYAVLFASSCRLKRNYPAAETEYYSEKDHRFAVDEKSYYVSWYR